ncbi:hypothetical protein [Chamaesiphon minutus]|uniref:Uncharacterized protein n=1 Tax=Chamaesiphon minutus (strain ATCC 27169 / PCC 6605) TaxID=1173020 RepID=K9UCL5_CHAP6|nr:hypothetical protein [Chamaesiphon minutus]AFY92827.1 hypothetical protein Cha6605_1695 [Chamaesiphon minutus PCC 6605]
MSRTRELIATKPTVTQAGIKVALSGDADSAVDKSARLQLQVTDAQTNQPIAAAVKISAIATEGELRNIFHQPIGANMRN